MPARILKIRGFGRSRPTVGFAISPEGDAVARGTYFGSFSFAGTGRPLWKDQRAWYLLTLAKLGWRRGRWVLHLSCWLCEIGLGSWRHAE